MTLPFIHIGGTSKQSLLDDNCEALHALRQAYEALSKASPNGRDYVPFGGPALYNEARKEHVARLEKIASVITELDELTQRISDL